MGAPKQKWTEPEEQALKAGVLKHGVGKWRAIQKDPCFRAALASRTNVDLKDKWRNLNTEQPSPKSIKWEAKIGDKRGRSKSESDLARSRKILAIADNNSEVMNDVKRSWKVQQSYSNDSKIKQPVPRLNSARQALTRLEDMVVAAIIALDGINGSSLDDLVLWIEEHCGCRWEDQGELQAKINALVEQQRLQNTGGRYALGGAVQRFIRDHNGFYTSRKVGSHLANKNCAKVAELAACAALAVTQAEEAADLATRLTQEADRLKARDRSQQARAGAPLRPPASS